MAVRPDQLAVAIRQLEKSQQALHALLALGTSWHSIQVRDVVEELATGQVRVHERFFVEVTEPGLGLERPRVNVEPVDEGPPRRRRQQTAEHAQRRRLSSAVRSEKAHDLPARHLEADAVDRLDHAVGLDEVLCLNRDWTG